MIRSVMEGVLLNIRSIAALGASAGLACDEVRVSGGATAEPLWLHMLADVLQREVITVTGASEGGAYGAVLAAGVGAGWWASLDEAVGALRVTGRVSPDASLKDLYDARFDTFRTLYDTLRPVYQRIAMENPSR
ncbi:xylulokinase [Caballeronia temeraria]|uniref:Xylulokinase n=2 Tax=Caballeronia temeraria TaxID=1777137 RepID=A0A158DQ16_9BURK|nr:xylulokinase [Caballeronia temeraria]